ncbi:MAG: transcription termination/antitermination protein NusA [Candidatus Andersenbacteria bacterium]|nr:transcription termination/antitermination protein NusA [Candidatus Andersenbacteria bacterium]
MAIDQIVAEKGISKEKVLETIEAALAAAYRKDFGERDQDIRAEFNEVDGSARLYKVITVVADKNEEGEEAEINEMAQLRLSDAKKDDPEAEVGKEYVEDVTPTDPHYGRVAAQTAKQVIIQRLREAEREATFDEYKGKEGEIISGIVQRMDGDIVFVDIGRTAGILFPSEQVRGERYRLGQRIRVYVVKVELGSRGPEIVLSRSHPGMLRRMFELEVPEIFAGSVQIKGIAREAGQRSKISVWSEEEGVDPVGACIGQRGTRIQTIIAELSGEKIDVIEWDADQAHYIANALSPARVIAVDIFDEEKRALAHVDEDQLSLAIGKRGQNVRLAAKLTGWRIDIARTGEEKEVEGGAEPTTEADPAEEKAKAMADDTVKTDNQPGVSEGTEEAAMDPAIKESHKEEAVEEKKDKE